jgi:hypothetical protein
MAKYEGPLPADPLIAVLRALESDLARFKAEYSHKEEEDTFIRGCHYGHIDGLKRAISLVRCEIGIRMNPPNIDYPGERPQ